LPPGADFDGKDGTVEMRISMFGVLSVHDRGRTLQGRAIGGAKPRGLLELLLLARGRPVMKEALAEALWPDGVDVPRDPIRTLEQYICVLRGRLCSDQEQARLVFATGSNSYRIDPAHVDIDVDHFDRLVRTAEHSDAAARRTLLTEAVSLARADLLADSMYASWAAIDRDLYRDRVARAHLWLASDYLQQGDMHVAIRHAEEAIRFAPYSERAYRSLMVANYGLGLDDMARSAYRRCRAALAAGVDLDPTSETVAVAAAIDAGAPLGELMAMAPARV
jgi:DNA-binding SARP family transcriptional activator